MHGQRAPRACGSSPRPPTSCALGEAHGRAACASWRWRSSADGEGAERVGRVVVQRRRRARSSRWRARWPTRRWSRPRCTARTPTSAASCRPPARRWPDGAPFVVDLAIEGRQVVQRGRRGRAWAPDELADLEQAVSGAEVEYELTMPGEGGETEVFFSDLSQEYVTASTRSTRADARRRHTPRGAALHPRVPRPDRGDQVRRRGHDRRASSRRSSRATSCSSSTSGMNPVVVHGGGPGHHRATWSGWAWRCEFVRGPAGVRRGHRRGGEDGAGRQAEQGHRAAPGPPRAAGGGPVRRRRAAVPCAQAAGRRRDATSASWARSSAWTWTCSTTSPRTTSR